MTTQWQQLPHIRNTPSGHAPQAAIIPTEQWKVQLTGFCTEVSKLVSRGQETSDHNRNPSNMQQ